MIERFLNNSSGMINMHLKHILSGLRVEKS